MSRLIVPRGNRWFSAPKPFVLASASPFWRGLSLRDRAIAKRTENLRPLLTLCMAQQTLQESLMDLRLARYLKDWQSLSDRLTRVKKAVFGSRNDEQFRKALQNPCRVRLILLGAQSQEAETISKDLVESVIGLRTAGEWKPDAKSRPWQNDPNSDIRRWGAGHDEQREYAALCWKQDGQKLKSGRTKWSKPFEDDELRAFAERPPADPFVAAQKFQVDQKALASVSLSSPNVPEGFTTQAVEHATKHVQNLFFLARRLILLADDPETVNPDRTDEAAYALDELSCYLDLAWASKPLRHAMHRYSGSTYRIASIVEPSVHEAIKETARQVFLAFRNAVGLVAFPDGQELERSEHGPWHGHEVSMALYVIHEKQTELRSVFESVTFQSHEANLRRESARLLSEVKDDLLTPMPSIAEVNPPSKHTPSQEGTKTPKSTRGRRAIDTKLTQRICNAWETGNYADYSQLAKEFDIRLKEVKAAIDRERKQRKRSAVKPS